MFENVDGRRTDDGRTTDAGVTGILIAHLGAFGSGELKKFKKKPTSVPNSLDPDQDQLSVSPDQGPNCLQR